MAGIRLSTGPPDNDYQMAKKVARSEIRQVRHSNARLITHVTVRRPSQGQDYGPPKSTEVMLFLPASTEQDRDDTVPLFDAPAISVSTLVLVAWWHATICMHPGQYSLMSPPLMHWSVPMSTLLHGPIEVYWSAVYLA